MFFMSALRSTANEFLLYTKTNPIWKLKLMTNLLCNQRAKRFVCAIYLILQIKKKEIDATYKSLQTLNRIGYINDGMMYGDRMHCCFDEHYGVPVSCNCCKPLTKSYIPNISGIQILNLE